MALIAPNFYHLNQNVMQLRCMVTPGKFVIFRLKLSGIHFELSMNFTVTSRVKFVKHTFSWNKTVATAKGMQEADIPTSAIARFTKNRWSWFLMDRFQNTTRHTEILPRIPISVVIPSKIPIIITIPDSGILCRGNVRVVKGWSCEPDKRLLLKLEMLLILISKGNVSCKLISLQDCLAFSICVTTKSSM